MNRILFCDTTERTAVCTKEAARRVHAATIEGQVVSTGANTLCTTPVEAAVATDDERASGAGAVASRRQG